MFLDQIGLSQDQLSTVLFIATLAALAWFLSWLLFPGSNSAQVNKSLLRVDGIDHGLGMRLRSFGVHSDQDLVHLTPRQQRELETKLNLSSGELRSWRNQIISRWRRAYLPAALRPCEDIVPDPELGGRYAKQPVEVDDLSKLAGIDQAAATRLNAEGIYTFEQLRLLTPLQRANVQRRFQLTAFDFEGIPTYGVTAASLARRARLARVPSSGNVPKPRSEGTLRNRDSVGEPTRSRSYAKGEKGTTVFPATAVSTTETAETNVLPRSKVDQELGRIYTAPPPHRDDLTQLVGIDAEAARKLNHAGVYTHNQLLSLSPQQQQHLQRRFNLQHVDFVKWRNGVLPTRQTTSEASAGTASRIQPDQSGAESKTGTHGIGPINVGRLHGIRLPELAPGVFDGRQLVAYPEQVVFRNTYPQSWGTTVKPSGASATRSLSAAEVRSDINYVRIRRVDTRDSVVVAVTKGQLFAGGPDGDHGWNGSCEEFFGGRHLGVFAKEVPNEVETKFGLGGWGFGHPAESNDQQQWCWAGRAINSVAFEIAVGHIGARAGTVVFRSSDPSIWNRRVREGPDHRAIPIDSVRHPISFLRLLRIDTGEAIIVPCDRDSVLVQPDNPPMGWNGSNEHFSGGFHLGIFHGEVPQEVEICLGQGGWGFGHPYGENNQQAYGWSGRAIDATVFEISLLDEVPDYLRHELLR